jgi:peptidyl-prolyl cis-trans isomerase SurA
MTEDNALLELDLAHILLKLPSDVSEAETADIRSRLEEIRLEIVNGLAFAEAARRYSDGNKASEGGLLGIRTAEQLPQLFLDAAEGVPAGGLSTVFKSSNGWHLLKVLARKSQQETVVLQQEVRHILIRASALLPDEQLRSRLERIRDRIVAGEDFGAVARLQSEDTNTRALGGNLGWLTPGELPGEFEQALDPLSVNEVSPVFQTAAGWHIAQITGEREKDVGNTLRRRQAERIIIARKTEEAFEEWTQFLREQAFVRYRVRPGE